MITDVIIVDTAAIGVMVPRATRADMIMIMIMATVVGNVNVEEAVMEAANHVPLSRIIARVTMLAARGQVEEVVGVDLITKYGRRVPYCS